MGGGFLLVPALVLFAGVETKMVVGTSLAIIALNSGAGLIGHVRYAELDWGLTAAFTTLTLVGILVGFSLGERLSEVALRRAFASILVVVGVVIGGLNLVAR